MKIILSFIIGSVIVGLAVFYYPTIIPSSNSFYVARVVSHHSNKLNNTETTLLIYNNGKSGHIRELVCLFPPDVTLPGEPHPRFGGTPVINTGLPSEPIFKVSIAETNQQYMGGKKVYYCEIDNKL